MAPSIKTINAARQIQEQANDMLSRAQDLAQRIQQTADPGEREQLDRTAREHAERARTFARIGKEMLVED